MDSVKKIREVLFITNNTLWLLLSNLLVLAGIGGFILTAAEIIKYGVDSGAYAIIGYIFLIPVLGFYSVCIFVPTIILGLVSGLAGIFAVIRLVAKSKKRKFVFAILNLIIMFLCTILMFVGVNIVSELSYEYDSMYSEGLSFIFIEAVKVFRVIPIIAMIIYVPLAAISIPVDIPELKVEEDEVGSEFED